MILAKRPPGYNTFPLRHLKELSIFKVCYLKKPLEKSTTYFLI
jgi:hypothetical protein